MNLISSFVEKYGVYLFVTWSGITLSVFFGYEFEKIFAQIPYYAILLLSVVIFLRFLLKDFLANEGKKSIFLMLLLIFVLCASMVQVLIYADYRELNKGVTTLVFLMNIYIVILTSTLLGIFISKCHFHVNSNFRFVILSILLFQWYGMLSEGGLIDWIGLNERKKTDEFASHLAMELPLTLLLVYFLSISRNYYRYLVLLVSVAILWSMGGRTLILSFIFTFIFIGVLTRKIYFLPIVVLIASAVMAYYFLIDQYANNIFVTRMLLLDGLDSDQSAISRDNYYRFAVDNIDKYLLIGNVGHYAEYFGDFGAYSHNVISFIQFYGLFFMLICVYIVYILFKTMTHFVVSDPGSSKAYFGLFLLILSLLGSLTGKYVGSALLWAALGYCSTYKPVSKALLHK